jgi:putative alpha-1,2-mannosidase
MNPDYDSAAYDRLGWPCDRENQAVPKLEYAYDDCASRNGQRRAKGRLRPFHGRAESWQISSIPRSISCGDSAGDGTPSIPRPRRITEGTSWQYSWYVPQDVPGLIALHGGKDNFTKKLDDLFTVRNPKSKRDEATYGVIGSYWHDNNSHHTVYLYSYAGQNWKA